MAIDYRPALRDRSGVGEYVYQLARALVAVGASGAAPARVELTLFSSSWKDRLVVGADLDGAALVDRRIPVRLLNAAWHRLEWPPIETLAGGPFDVVHSPTPLLLPSRRAARVVTIHDLYFLDHPDQTAAEVRRDYPALTKRHAHRADRIIVPSRATAAHVARRLGVDAARISICAHGRPPWQPRAAAPGDGYLLFVGTLEPRKNIGGLLDAYERLIAGAPGVPPLLLAGRPTAAARGWLDRIGRPPLAGAVRHIGYVDPGRRREIYEGARLLVLPSFDEGFGLPALEAMTIGVPVVAADRGALPEVVGDAGLLVDPESPDAIASAIRRLLDDGGEAAACASKGIRRSLQFDWAATARGVLDAYRRAIEHRRCASA